MNKIITILKRDGVLFTSKRFFAWVVGHTPFWSLLSFQYYKNYRLVFAPSMLTYVLFANPHTRDEDVKVIEKFVAPADIVIDIGAHIGSTVLVEASQSGGAGKVLAFEASPTFFKYLKENITINELETIVDVYPYAIGDTESSVLINESVKDDTTNHISDIGTEVKQVRLDDFTKDFAKINFIKVDVEGYEPMVLAGATETLKKTDCLYIEFCTSNLKNLGFLPSDMISKLQENFSLQTLTSDKLIPFEFNPEREYVTDLIALKI